MTPFLARPGQRVEEHLQRVADMAAEALHDWPEMASLAHLAGLLHDLGKCSCAWQDYLAAKTGNTDTVMRLEHAWTSGDAAQQLLKDADRVTQRTITTAIIGHHGSMGRTRQSGDPDRVSEALRWFSSAFPHEPVLQAIAANGWGRRVDPPPPTVTRRSGTGPDQAHACVSGWVEQEIVQRIIQSTLIDADWTDAQAAAAGRVPQLTASQPFHKFGEEFERNNRHGIAHSVTSIDRLRTSVFDEAVATGHESNGAPGFYLLDAPTGLGKTRSSLGFAFAHAQHSHVRRLVFAAPFISVTSQNVAATRALVFGSGAGAEHVLEHHSMVEGQSWKARAATQNWDAPIVITTSIQLLQSLHSCRLSSIRKLHRLAGSIIVLDEWQTIPLELLIASMQTLSILVRNFGTTVLLTSATPRLVEHRSTLVTNVKRVVSDTTSTEAAKIARARVRWNFTHPTSSWADVARQFIDDPARAKLMIVNTRAAAAETVEHVAAADTSMKHLSTSMTPAHRNLTLGEVRRRLGIREPITLIATQVIEAGVDVSFESLWREAAPLESLIQAAGRCNRNGEYDNTGVVTVFEVHGSTAPTASYRRRANETLRLCRDRSRVPTDPDVVNEYETSRAADAVADYNQHFRLVREAQWLPESDKRFIEIEQRYQLIDDLGTSVICTNSNPALINELINQHDTAINHQDVVLARTIRRRLSLHTVSLPDHLTESIPPVETPTGLTIWGGPYGQLLGVDTRRP